MGVTDSWTQIPSCVTSAERIPHSTSLPVYSTTLFFSVSCS